jgi:hypothetical protein
LFMNQNPISSKIQMVLFVVYWLFHYLVAAVQGAGVPAAELVVRTRRTCIVGATAWAFTKGRGS